MRLVFHAFILWWKSKSSVFDPWFSGTKIIVFCLNAQKGLEELCVFHSNFFENEFEQGCTV